MSTDSSDAPRLSALASLRRFARPRPVREHCDLCSVGLADEHAHLLELSSRRLVCACDACAILFDNPSAGKYRRVPRGVQLLRDFHLPDEAWVCSRRRRGGDTMNRVLVDRIANAVLYEGYILYPYRPSVKNRQRWTFGGLYPDAYCQAGTDESASNQTECLVTGSAATTLEAVVRFLHLIERTVGELIPPLTVWPVEEEPSFRAVPSLRIGERTWHSWQEAEEREVALGDVTLGELSRRPRRVSFSFRGSRCLEPVRGTDGAIAGVMIRQQQSIAGDLEAQAVELSEGLFRLSLRVINRTPMAESGARHRDAAVLRSLVSTHVLLGVRAGTFVSLLDPPECWREAAAACRNVGVWPVLVGTEGQNDTMLSSPIILYDYPQVAAESPGDFFDGTEIDELLTLRILTLTDDEKRDMAAVDERARELLTRTEALAHEQMLELHGTLRSPKESLHG